MESNPPALPPRPRGALNAASKTTEETASSAGRSTALPPPALPPRQRGVGIDAPSADATTSSRSGGESELTSPTTGTADQDIITSTAEVHSAIHSTLDRVQKLWLGAIRRDDTPEEAVLRKELEEEEVIRYLTSFQKHANHFRLDQTSQPISREPFPKPDLKDFKNVIEREGNIAVLLPSNVEGKDMAANEANIPASAEEVTMVPDNPSSRPIPTRKITEPIAVMPGDMPPRTQPAEEVMTDWFGYFIALLQYHLLPLFPLPSSTTPSPLPQPFTIARMRSSSERLYVSARPPWERLGLIIGEVVLWEDWKKSLTWAVIYSFLVITSKFVPFLLSIPLYHLLKARFFPPSPYYLLAEAQHTKLRTEEAKQLSSDVIQDSLGTSLPSSSDNQPSSSSPLGNFSSTGIKLNLGEAASRIGMGEAASRIEAEIEASVKPAKENKRMWRAWKRFEEKNGVGLVVVMDDLADMHEKMANLFAWKRPTASFHAILLLSILIPASLFLANIVLLKLAQVGFGVLMFVVIPIVARMERYEPLAWTLGDAPTDAEYVTELLRKRQAAGEGIPDIAKIKRAKALQARTEALQAKASDAASITSADGGGTSEHDSDTVMIGENGGTSTLVRTGDNNGKVKGHGKKPSATAVDWTGIAETGTRWLDGGRAVLKGEMGVSLGWKEGDPKGVSTAGAGPVREMKFVGPGGYGFTIASKDAERSAILVDSTTFLAVHKGKSGTLAVSPGGLYFSTFLPVPKPKPPKPSKNATDPAQIESPSATDATSSLSAIAAADALAKSERERLAADAIDPSGIVQVKMEDVVGLKKTSKSSFMVVITSGMEVEITGGELLAFPFVANRDQAFNLLLALSPQSFRKI